MKYNPIPSSLFENNRKNFIENMHNGAIAIFNSNDAMPTNADGMMGFRQNSDLFYLSGIDQEETTLVLFPDHHLPSHREILFVKETNEHIAIWEGNKLSKEETRKYSGIETIFWSHQFESTFKNMVFAAEHIYLNTNEHLRSDTMMATRNDRFVGWCKEKFPLHQYHRSAPILQNLRMIKSEEEIALIEQACGITDKAFRRLLPFIKPGVMEYEIEAEILHEFVRNKSRGPAYASIIASGKSACILHYISNDKACKKDELILMDFGAEYANYAADLTRCVPVSGGFSKRHKEVYQAVLRILNHAQNLMKPGLYFKDYNQIVAQIVEEELVELKLISAKELKAQDKKNPLYKQFFMHGISHFLGLDVHDVGRQDVKFAAGMVLTCEPGIYLPREGFGIRLENDILITKKGAKNLMANIPIEVDEIESLMHP